MEYQIFNGQKFAKYRGLPYWQHTSTTERMHRYVWKFYNGDIPKGYDVHHKDHNKDNNDISNLELLPKSEHYKRHMQERTDEQKAQSKANCDRIRPLTKAWHGSEQGHEWHKQHYEAMKEKLHVLQSFVCLVCGKEFTSTKVGSKFCCNAHKSQYRRNLGLDNIEKTCPICGKTFKTNKFAPNLTCGRKCGAELRKSNKNRKTT